VRSSRRLSRQQEQPGTDRAPRVQIIIVCRGVPSEAELKLNHDERATRNITPTSVRDKVKQGLISVMVDCARPIKGP